MYDFLYATIIALLEQNTVNSHYSWIRICESAHLLKFICNPKINTQCFQGHSQVGAEG